MAFKGSKEYASEACKQTGNTLYDTASSALENITQSFNLSYGQNIYLLMSTWLIYFAVLTVAKEVALAPLLKTVGYHHLHQLRTHVDSNLG